MVDYFQTLSTPDDTSSSKKYLFYRNAYKTAINDAKAKDNEKQILSSSNPVKKMWELINTNRKSSSVSGASTVFSADDFNKYFSSVAKDLVGNIGNTTGDPSNFQVMDITNPFTFRLIEPEEVMKCIADLKNTNGFDVYGINSKMIKRSYLAIVFPLTHLVNESFESGIFPSILKVAEVIPLFKKGSCSDIENHRPISKLPVFSKIIEKAMKIQICDFFESNNLFSDHQFGFRNSRSTKDAILEFSNFVLDAFETGSYASAVMVDVAKAFDCVPHGLLIDQLSKYSFDDKAISLVSSYLSSRSQAVRHKNELSEFATIQYGVPQGSVLGPLLFIIFINDLPQCIFNPTILFADDSTIVSRERDVNHLISNNSASILQITNWFNRNGLSVNDSKTQTICFGLRDLSTVRSNPDYVKILGVLVDPKQNWKHHCECLVKSLNSIIFLLRRLSDKLSKASVLAAFHAVFLSRASYAIICWGHSPSTSLIFSCQRRAVRAIAGIGYRADCKSSFIDLNILTIPAIYILECIMYVHSHLSDFRLISHSYQTRSANNLVVPFMRLCVSRNCMNWWGPKFFNVIPENIRDLSSKAFKNKMSIFLRKVAPYCFDDYFLAMKTAEFH
uniref:Putative RNA-directed DNA polymerase from transposon BS n=1 Tax=Lygus hesperus TaxID=30085 RepID=A0A0A9YGB1_LYGHE